MSASDTRWVELTVMVPGVTTPPNTVTSKRAGACSVRLMNSAIGYAFFSLCVSRARRSEKYIPLALIVSMFGTWRS